MKKEKGTRENEGVKGRLKRYEGRRKVLDKVLVSKKEEGEEVMEGRKLKEE